MDISSWGYDVEFYVYAYPTSYWMTLRDAYRMYGDFCKMRHPPQISCFFVLIEWQYNDNRTTVMDEFDVLMSQHF
jgi:hypothetical protein